MKQWCGLLVRLHIKMGFVLLSTELQRSFDFVFLSDVNSCQFCNSQLMPIVYVAYCWS